MLDYIKQSHHKPLLVFILLLPVLTFISKGSVDAVFSLMAVFLLFYSIKHKNFQWVNWAWMRAILIFLVVAMLSALCFSPFPQEAFIQSLIYVRWPLAAAALILFVFTTEQRLQLFERAALIFLVLAMADGIFQMVTGVDILGHQAVDNVRMTAFFKKRVLGVYSLKLFFFAFTAIYLAMKKTNKNYLLMTLIIVLFDVFLLLTGERIIFLLGVLFLIVWTGVLIYLVKEIRTKISALLLFSGAIFAVFVAFNHQLLAKRVVPFIDAMKNFSATTYSDIFNAAYQLWLLNPLFGIGTRMFNEVCLAKLGYPQDESLVDKVDGLCVRHPHNIYLEVLAQNGVIGFCLFIFVLYFIFKQIVTSRAWRVDPLLMSILAMSVVVIFWPFTSSMSIFANNYAGAVWLTIAWATARTTQMQPMGARE